jgi:hypothetical protein
MYEVKLSRRLKLINSSRADIIRAMIIIALMMGTETVPETLDFNELTRLSAREEFIIFLHQLNNVRLQQFPKF